MKLTLKLLVLLLVVCCQLAAAQQPTPQAAQPPPNDAEAEAPSTGKEKDFSKRPLAKSVTEPWTRPKLNLAEEINLASPKVGKYEAARTVKGGEVIQTGWKATDKLDSAKVELKRGFTSEESGGLNST